MFRRSVAPVALFLVAALAPAVASAATSPTSVTINCDVVDFWTWSGPATITIPQINTIGQIQNAAGTFTCYTNSANNNITIMATAAGDLTFSGKTLATKYSLNGAGITNGDATPAANAECDLDAAAFKAKTYQVNESTAAVGMQLILIVSAKSGLDPSQLPAGTYTTSVTLQATF